MTMLNGRRVALLAAVLALAAGAPARAAIVNFAATIDGAQETPPMVTPAMASGTFVMDTVANTLSVNVIITVPPPSGEIAAHIHGFAPPGVPAGILFPLPLGSPKIAVWNFLEAEQANIIADLTYVNIHSNASPAGEIRGQILRVPSCGDTVVDGPGEECDDGNNTAGDGCDATCQNEVLEIGVVPTKLIVVDKLVAATKAKTVFVAKDVAVTKGPGTDPTDIEVEFTAAYGNGSATGSFLLPAGDPGWLVNKSTVAKFVNKTAPAGSTQAKVGVIKPGKLVKLVGKGLGDTMLDILGAGDPAGPVHTAYCVTNGGTVACHCSSFGACIYKLIAGDTGAKLVCKGGTADGACTAAP